MGYETIQILEFVKAKRGLLFLEAKKGLLFLKFEAHVLTFLLEECFKPSTSKGL